MTVTLSFIEVINAKKATERAIAKLLLDLERETGIKVENISIQKVNGWNGMIVKIESKFE